MDLTDHPCHECLVRACCRDACSVMKDYVLEVLELVVKDPHHRILSNFSPEQIEIIESTANIVRRRREDERRKNNH